MRAVPESIVLLHGFTQTGASWDPVRSRLGERYRVLAPDLPGHGPDGSSAPVDLDAAVASVLAVAPARFVLGGYSMGGRVALHAALAAPGRVARLVLVGTTAGIEDSGARAERRAADEGLAERIEGMAIEAFATEWAATPVLAGQPPGVLAAAHADRLRSRPAGLAAALRGLGQGACPPVWDRLAELELPVVLVVGERDERYRAIAARLEAALPAAVTLTVPGAGHAVHLEAPGTVAAVLGS